MSKYFNADEFFETFGELNIEPYNNFPTADVVPTAFHDKCMQIEIEKRRNMVEVVPCKDCVNWQKDQSVDLYGSHYCPRMDTRTMEDDYCSYGERREYDRF